MKATKNNLPKGKLKPAPKMPAIRLKQQPKHPNTIQPLIYGPFTSNL